MQHRDLRCGAYNQDENRGCGEAQGAHRRGAALGDGHDRQRSARLGLMFEVAHGRRRGESTYEPAVARNRQVDRRLTGFGGTSLGYTPGYGRPLAGRSAGRLGTAIRPADGQSWGAEIAGVTALMLPLLRRTRPAQRQPSAE